MSGSTVNITWTFDDDIANVVLTNSDSSSKRTIAVILSNQDSQEVKNILPQLNAKPPATLVMNNVGQGHNGTYEFKLQVNGGHVHKSNVVVFIASKFHICQMSTYSLHTYFLINFLSNEFILCSERYNYQLKTFCTKCKRYLSLLKMLNQNMLFNFLGYKFYTMRSLL